MKIRTVLKEGDELIAKDECVMLLTGQKSLTIGKPYLIIKMFATAFRIKDDQGQDHIFELRKGDDASWRKFFRRAKKK